MVFILFSLQEIASLSSLQPPPPPPRPPSAPRSNLTNYYESLRNNVITLLEHVRIPQNGSQTVPSSVPPPIISTGGYTYSHSGPSGTMTPSYGAHPYHQGPHEPFDSYISKLQSLCVPSDVYGPLDDSRPIYDALKPAVHHHHQDYAVLPTAI